MITNKLDPHASKSSILVELSDASNPPESLNLLSKQLKQEQIPFKRSILPEYQINIYYVLAHKSTSYKSVSLENIPSQFEHAMTILYLNHDNYEKVKLPQKNQGRTLIVRQDLDDDFFSLEYEVQNVGSKIQGLTFLCYMIAGFINRMASNGVQFYDKNVQGVFKIRKDSENILKQTWANILFQVPGLGKQKCLRIIEQFPTYQSILEDYTDKQRLKDLQIARGAKKTAKLGPQLATRIYKVFLGTKYQDSVI